MVGKPVPPKPVSPPSAAPIPGSTPSTSPGNSEKTFALSNRPSPSQAAATALASVGRGGASADGNHDGSTSGKTGGRLVSLDAFRGFIMMMLAANGFGLLAFSRISEESPVWQFHDRALWQQIGAHFDHPAWASSFDFYKVSFWDLIQPAFMFMVGVAMPFSYARRETQGQSRFGRTFHALVRSAVLVLLGVFLASRGHERTVWEFPNVLCQIGLGYFVAWLLLNRGRAIQFSALAVILIGYWGWFYFNPPPAEYDYEAVGVSEEKGEILEGSFAPWSKNANAAFLFDQWLLPRLRSSADQPGATEERVKFLPMKLEWRPVGLIQLEPQEPNADRESGDESPETESPSDPPETPDPAGGSAEEPSEPDLPDESSAAEPEDSPAASDSDTAEGDTAGGDAAGGDAAGGDAAEGDAAEGDAAGSDAAGSDAAGSDAAEGVGTEAAASDAGSETEKEDAPATGPAVWICRAFFGNTEPYKANAGGYTTLNFIPSIATTLLGILCGQLLIAPSKSRWSKLGLLIVAAAACVGLGIAADLTVCPVVKRIWTPSWVLFSGGYVIGMLALFYFLFDILPLKFLAFPLVVVGMNSILTYMLGQTISGWMRENVVRVHLSGFIDQVCGTKTLDPQWYGPIALPTTVFLLYWLLLLWLYRQKIFLRI